MDSRVPPNRDFLWPVVCAIREQGGSGVGVSQMFERVVRRMGITEEQLRVTSPQGNPTVKYRIGFTRTRLKQIGVIDNPEWGFWVLTERGRTATEDQILRWYDESERNRRNRY